MNHADVHCVAGIVHTISNVQTLKEDEGGEGGGGGMQLHGRGRRQRRRVVSLASLRMKGGTQGKRMDE
jgi:hypothetical protein